MKSVKEPRRSNLLPAEGMTPPTSHEAVSRHRSNPLPSEPVLRSYSYAIPKYWAGQFLEIWVRLAVGVVIFAGVATVLALDGSSELVSIISAAIVATATAAIYDLIHIQMFKRRLRLSKRMKELAAHE